MITRVHKIKWPRLYAKSEKDVYLEVTEVDCFVTEVSHPIAKWAVGEAWVRVSSWFAKKGCKITEGEDVEG